MHVINFTKLCQADAIPIWVWLLRKEINRRPGGIPAFVLHNYTRLLEVPYDTRSTTQELIYMAKKGRGFDFTFASIVLSEEDRKQFLIYAKENEKQLSTLLIGTLNNSYKLSLSCDTERSTYIATLVRKGDVEPNVKSSLSARHSDLMTAQLLVLYKHHHLCENGNWATGRSAEVWG